MWSASVRSLRSVVALGDLPSVLNCSQLYSPKLCGRAWKNKGGSQRVRGRIASRILLQKLQRGPSLATCCRHNTLLWKKNSGLGVFCHLRSDRLGRPTAVATRRGRGFTRADEKLVRSCFIEGISSFNSLQGQIRNC